MEWSYSDVATISFNAVTDGVKNQLTSGPS